MDNPKRGWRPTEIYPLAALFPVMPDDELAALAEHIKKNGLQVPIVIDDDGVLIDGRMRLEACKRAGVEPTYQRLNGHDPKEYIWGANGKRRQMTKGQMAMIAAMAVSFPEKGTHNPKGGRPDQGKARAAKASGVSPARISQALLVKEHAPHLVQEVIDGTLALNAAYKTAQENERQRRWREDGVAMLREADPDLAQRVIDDELDIEAARKELERRKKERHERRGSVLIGLSHALYSLNRFDQSSALAALPDELCSDKEAEAHLLQYFKGGTDELGELIEAASKGLAAIRKVYGQIQNKKARRH